MCISKMVEQELNRRAGRLVECGAKDDVRPGILQTCIKVGADRNLVQSLRIDS